VSAVLKETDILKIMLAKNSDHPMKKSIVLILTLVALSLTASMAQPINRPTPESNRKAAMIADSTNNPYAALELWQDVYDVTKDKPVLKEIARNQYLIRDYVKAEKTYSKLVLRDRKGEYTELKYWLAMSMKANAKYAEAEDMFNQYIAEGADDMLKKKAKVEIAGCQLGVKAKPAENIIITNAGKKVNSPQTEASPSANNGELYFTSMKAKDVITIDGKEGDWYTKIYSAGPGKAPGEYGDPTVLGTQINREGFVQGNVSITPDGKTMYFTRVQMNNNVMSESKIFYAKKGADGWGAASEVKGVNGDYLAKHPCEGELFGEKVLFFVANMTGGKGGDDIFYATKKGDGQFGLPVNLGAVVNTAGDEATPFYRDGKLYFSSNGLPSLGGFDVFETQWNGSVWSTPKPLPMGINTSLDDLYYSVAAADGMSGFLVSNRPGPNNLKSATCCDDIYTWEYERIKVEVVAKTFRFKKKGEKENQPLTGCIVQIYDVTEKNPMKVEEKNNGAANDFSFTLAPEKSYKLIASRDGYVGDTISINTVGIKKSTTVEKKLTLHTVKKEEPAPTEIEVEHDKPILLSNIYYDYDKWDIKPESEPDLQSLVDLMTEHPDMKIELRSHTDSRGRDDYNMTLSQKRAESAKSWIVAKGISGDRIVAKGYGETQLLNGCTNGVQCSEDEHRLNRRTEFVITAGPTVIKIKTREKVIPKDAGDKPKTKAGGKQSYNPVFFYRL
jgi:peptidoglycan-associated lipoprotein